MDKESVLESFDYWLSHDFCFSYLLALSVLIVLVFGLFGKWQYRVAWYIAVSAPGAPVSLDFLFSLFDPVIRGWFSTGTFPPSAAHSLFSSLVVIPAIWVLPVVLGVQLVKLARREWRPTTNASDWAVAGLALLYPAFDLVMNADKS